MNPSIKKIVIGGSIIGVMIYAAGTYARLHLSYDRLAAVVFRASQFTAGTVVRRATGFPLRPITSPPVEPVHVDAQWPADFRDDRALVGAAHNIFAGTVVAKIGTKARGIGLETQFAVKVLYNIKGSLNGIITVDEFGGERNGVVYIPDGALWLEPGATYLLMTRYNEQEDWHTIIPYPSANRLIMRSTAVSDIQLQTIIINDARVKDLQLVYPNEKVLDVDMKRNNARNSYRSLPSPL